MNKKRLLKEFREEFLLSKKYKYSLSTDDGGSTIVVFVPEKHRRLVRKKLPTRWRDYRTIVLFREEPKISEDEDE